jgi:hypothetical protein
MCHSADNKNDWPVLRDRVDEFKNVDHAGADGGAELWAAGGEVYRDGIFNNFEEGVGAVGCADFQLMEKLD